MNKPIIKQLVYNLNSGRFNCYEVWSSDSDYHYDILLDATPSSIENGVAVIIKIAIVQNCPDISNLNTLSDQGQGGHCGEGVLGDLKSVIVSAIK